MSEKMLPCPACGSENLRIRCNPVHKNWNAMSAVSCDDCYTQGPTVIGDEAAIKAWNALPRALRWTKEPPKVAGLYVCRCQESNQIRLYRLHQEDVDFYAKYGGNGEWAGPIPEPKEK